MRRLFLFLKAHQPGLFDEQVTVSGHATKTGTYVQAYQAKRKKRHDEPQAGDLFAEAAAPKPSINWPEHEDLKSTVSLDRESARLTAIERLIKEESKNPAQEAMFRGFYKEMIGHPSKREDFSVKLQVSYDQGVQKAKREREMLNDRFGGVWYFDRVKKDGSKWGWRVFREGYEIANGKASSEKAAQEAAFSAKMDDRGKQPSKTSQAPKPKGSEKATDKEPWEMTLDEFAQSRIDASGYADAYREDPESANAFKKEQGSKWVDALRARAKEGRIPDSALDDFVGRHGISALQREFRGLLEKGIEGYQPPDVRNSPPRPPKPKEPEKKPEPAKGGDGGLFGESDAPTPPQPPKPKKEPTPEQAKRQAEKSPAAKYAPLTHIAEKFGFGRGYAENVYFKEFPKPNGKPGETYQISIEQVSIDGKPAWKVSSSLKYVDGKGYKTAVPGESHIANSIDETRSRLNAIMDGIGIPRPREEDAAEKAPAPRKKPHRFNLDEPPHIQTLLNHAWQVAGAAQPGAIRPLSAMTDKEIAYGWAYSHAADQLARYGVHPKGYNERAHHHIIPQIRNKGNLDAIDAEMERRGLNDKYELDIGAYWEHAPGFKKSATITEPADELIGEHRRLVRVLRSPSHADDLKEAAEQESELREYEKKAKRKKKVCKAFLVAPLHQLLKARAHA